MPAVCIPNRRLYRGAGRICRILSRIAGMLAGYGTESAKICPVASGKSLKSRTERPELSREMAAMAKVGTDPGKIRPAAAEAARPGDGCRARAVCGRAWRPAMPDLRPIGRAWPQPYFFSLLKLIRQPAFKMAISSLVRLAILSLQGWAPARALSFRT